MGIFRVMISVLQSSVHEPFQERWAGISRVSLATVCPYPWQNMQQLRCDTCSPAVALDQLTVPLIRRHQRAHTQHIPEEPTHEFPVADLCGKNKTNPNHTRQAQRIKMVKITQDRSLTYLKNVIPLVRISTWHSKKHVSCHMDTGREDSLGAGRTSFQGTQCFAWVSPNCVDSE